MEQESETETRQRREDHQEVDRRKKMACKLLITVLCSMVAASAIPISDLLDRASQHSDKLHSLSTTLSHELDSQFPPMGRAIMPRPSMCHTSALQMPNGKEQALQASESELLSLARSLLQAWVNPLVLLSSSAGSLPHPAQSSISSKVQELQEHSRNLGDGLDVLSSKMDPAAQVLSYLPYSGSNDVGQDRLARLINFSFLLSCFRRDSHKIDSFLKVLRCRAVKLHPHLC